MTRYQPFYHPSTISFSGKVGSARRSYNGRATLTRLLSSSHIIEMVEKLVEVIFWLNSANFHPFFYYLPSTILKRENKKEGGEYAAEKNTRVRVVVGRGHFGGLSA